MTELVLKQAGVRVEHSSRGTSYYIPCELCGREIWRTQFSIKRTYICDYCKTKEQRRKKELQRQKEWEETKDIKTKHDIRFEKAVAVIKDQVKNFKDYESAIKIAWTACEKYGSIPEAVVAIELIRLGYKIIPQQKIGRYIADFVIPDKKLVIEVDGKTFHGGAINAKRENTIQLSLGVSWTIIHIPAEDIVKDIQKLQTIIFFYL